MTDYIVLSEVLWLRHPTNLQLSRNDVVNLKEIGLDPGRIASAVAKGFFAEYTDEYQAEAARLLAVETVEENAAKTETVKVLVKRGKRRMAAQIKKDKAANRVALEAAIKNK